MPSVCRCRPGHHCPSETHPLPSASASGSEDRLGDCCLEGWRRASAAWLSLLGHTWLSTWPGAFWAPPEAGSLSVTTPNVGAVPVA